MNNLDGGVLCFNNPGVEKKSRAGARRSQVWRSQKLKLSGLLKIQLKKLWNGWIPDKNIREGQFFCSRYLPFSTRCHAGNAFLYCLLAPRLSFPNVFIGKPAIPCFLL
jgi:hypothetical protein